MKNVYVLLVFLAVAFVQGEIFIPRHGLPPPDPPKLRSLSPTWGNITQKLDHFDENNSDSWNMRYIQNDQFGRPGGPIFIMVGAEWTIDEGWLQTGNMYDMAQQHGGYMFYTEHRYYGKSHPKSNLSPANLQYLTTDLALADVAYFIKYIKKSMPHLANSKVVICGCSYGGNMAIWLRLKYPEIVHAAVSSSAPVYAKVDFNEYHEVVASVLGPSCASVISQAVDQIIKTLETPAGISKLQTDFNLCRRLYPDDQNELKYFFMTIAGRIGGQIQNAEADTVTNICSVLQNTALGTEYDRLAKLVETETCKSGYQEFVNAMSLWDLNKGDYRQWFYQTCTEYGYFQTSSLDTALYRKTIPVDIYHKLCLELFGGQFNANRTYNGVARTNSVYGGYTPQVTRVISLHGSADPWHILGLSKDLNNDAPVVVIPGTSHCADIYSPSSDDPTELKNAKYRVQEYVKTWLSRD